MNRPIRYTVRLMVIIAVLATIPMIFTQSEVENSPYLSALSDLTAGEALAAKPCSGTICAPAGFRCGLQPGFNCKRHKTKCTGQAC